MEKKERNPNSYSELPEGEELSPAKAARKESRKIKENRELRILKKGKSIKERSDPNRFSGDGISFRAKIIGIEHVSDARGNRMCQGALQRLKAAVKTSGDHKQKIVLNISLEGIIIKDEKSGEVLHHHPIHKISFISQDTKDSRAFGYVYGCPQTGHQFFAIKTEKAASQVVVTLRDLFLVALEIKKKEIEKTLDVQKDDIEAPNKSHENGISNGNIETSNSGCHAVGNCSTQYPGICHGLLYSNMVLLPEEDASEKYELNPPEPEAALLNLQSEVNLLQSEVNILQQGISQMDQSIAVSQNLGISFSEDEVSESSCNSIPTAFQFKLDKLSSLYHETLSVSSRSSSTSDYNVAENKAEDVDTPKKDPLSGATPSVVCTSGVSSLSTDSSSTVSEASHSNSINSCAVEDRYAVFLDIDSIPSIFDNPSIVKPPDEKVEQVSVSQNDCDTNEDETSDIKSCTPVAFAELDPLGNQPYVDKSDFFQDIKKPPKKVLKDLVGANIDIPENDALSNSQESLGFIDLKWVAEENAFPFSPALGNPPKLPPKRFPFLSSELSQDSDPASWESKNPFNPFLCEEYPDIPPPSSPPPPPPPRLPTKALESSPSMSPPPPRPPSRVNGIPTPPLPKRKVPLNSTNRTWFSFDQDAVVFPSTPFPAEPETHTGYAPPLPSPARKLPPSKPEALKSLSASNSPATLRRFSSRSPHLGSSSVTKDLRDPKVNILASSPRKVLSRHSSIAQETDMFSLSTINPFMESSESHAVSDDASVESSPPLPPKPVSIVRSRPSPIKKGYSEASCTSSYSGSSMSAVESSNGTHSSSSLVFSSLDENKIGSSSEALFTNSTDSHSEVFSQNSKETIQLQSSNGLTEEKPTDLSPDSIFRRKSDPFADDFFLSLHKTSDCDLKNSNGVEVHFENLKAPT